MRTEMRSEGAVLTARPEGPHLDLGTAEAFKAQVEARLAEGKQVDPTKGRLVYSASVRVALPRDHRPVQGQTK